MLVNEDDSDVGDSLMLVKLFMSIIGHSHIRHIANKNCCQHPSPTIVANIDVTPLSVQLLLYSKFSKVTASVCQFF